MYHMQQGFEDIQNIETFERKWIIDRFIEQKEKEKRESQKISNQIPSPKK